MDMATVLEAADAIKRLKMYPYFDVAHYILNCMAVREDSYHQPATGTTFLTGKMRNNLKCPVANCNSYLFSTYCGVSVI